jgi:hypothetical protein
MTKPATAAKLRKLLTQVLKQLEDSVCANVAMSGVLREHGLLSKQVDDLAHSTQIRAAVRARFAPLLTAIEREDDEALRQELQRMPPERWMN